MTNTKILILSASITLGLCFQMSTAKHDAPINPQYQLDQAWEHAFARLNWVKAMAADESVGAEECNAKDGGTAFQTCRTSGESYQHGALNFFNSTLCMFNDGFTAGPESALCHFDKSMGMKPGVGESGEITKTFAPEASDSEGNKAETTSSVVLTYGPPTETFATDLGYEQKATVSVNGATYMVIYWGGKDKDSKGFMIEGSQGFGGDTLSRATYIQWDRTGETQFVKVFGGQWSTSYLGASTNGNRATYGSATYNSTSKAVSTQITVIEPNRQDGSALGCYRMFSTGTKGGAITVAKTDDAHNLTGHAVSLTTKTGTAGELEMDGVTLPDVTTTANGCQSGGNPDCTNLTDFSSVSFTKSCADLNSAGATGQPFAGNDANFALAPSDLF